MQYEGFGTTTKVDCAPHCGCNYFLYPWIQSFEFGHSTVQVGVTNQAPVPTRLRPLSHCVIGASPGALGSKSCSGETFVDDARG